MGLSEEQQQRRRDWARQHWELGVKFNRLCEIKVQRWDQEGVEMLLPYDDQLSAHDGIFHGGVIASLIDTAAGGAVMAGHNFDLGSRLTTVSMALQYLSVAPYENVVAYARCTRRGRNTHYAAVDVRSATGKALAQGLVTVNISGERPGLAEALDQRPS